MATTASWLEQPPTVTPLDFLEHLVDNQPEDLTRVALECLTTSCLVRNPNELKRSVVLAQCECPPKIELALKAHITAYLGTSFGQDEALEAERAIQEAPRAYSTGEENEFSQMLEGIVHPTAHYLSLYVENEEDEALLDSVLRCQLDFRLLFEASQLQPWEMKDYQGTYIDWTPVYEGLTDLIDRAFSWEQGVGVNLTNTITELERRQAGLYP